jgi:hypothetical protein
MLHLAIQTTNELLHRRKCLKAQEFCPISRGLRVRNAR